MKCRQGVDKVSTGVDNLDKVSRF